jgi:hypothetical protein
VKRVLFLLALTIQTSFAGARHFTFLYEAPTAAPGSFELENYATGVFRDAKFRGIDFRHELEIGLTDHFQASLYFANWHYDYEERAFAYDTASVEFIYNFTNPAADFIGLSFYQEIGAGRRASESETKLIAQKNFGPLILLYNFTVEAEWEGKGLHERNGELQQAIGASYEVTPRISFGAELMHEIVLPEWERDESDTNLFAGPNLSYRADRWFATVTALKQITNTEDEADYRLRLIFGISL